MTDIEKAIRYFKSIRDNAMVVFTRKTDFVQHPLLYENRKSYASLGITALKKQIPQKPSIIAPWDDTELFYCPVCEKKIVSKIKGEWFAGSRQKYCGNCGQALDWRE